MDKDLKYLIDVKHFAFEAHQAKNQMYGDSPYYVHLNDVIYNAEKYLYELKRDRDRIIVLAASSGHDLVEDACCSYNQLVKVFGVEVADVIYGVTNETGKTRAEKAKKTLPKTARDARCIYVKICDRMANTSNSKRTKYRMYGTYVKEYPEFRRWLKNGNMYPQMWKDLDALNDYVEPAKKSKRKAEEKQEA